MTMWADNIKFVKDIIDSKYQKIDAASAEVRKMKSIKLKSKSASYQMTENAEALLKDPSCSKSKEHFTSAVRVLELVQTNEIEMLLETIIGVRNNVQMSDSSSLYIHRTCMGKRRKC